MFCCQMYHACLACVFEPLKVGTTTPEVVKCPDGHFHRAVYRLGPYIADYLEQVWLAGIVQGWCPKYISYLCSYVKFLKFHRCNAPLDHLNCLNSHQQTHEKTDFLISAWDLGTLWSDLGICADIIVSCFHLFKFYALHQIFVAIHSWIFLGWHPWALVAWFAPSGNQRHIQGSYIMWINQYLVEEHGEACAHEIIADIDHQYSILLLQSLIKFWLLICRISAVPPFPRLWWFPDGCDFVQWTGDDSKALMKVDTAKNLFYSWY